MKSEAETQGREDLLIGGRKEFPGPNPYEMEVRNVQNGPYDGGKRFPGGGGIYLLGNPFQGEDFYCHTSHKSLPGGKDLLGGGDILTPTPAAPS